jgi:hypothetical protein
MTKAILFSQKKQKNINNIYSLSKEAILKLKQILQENLKKKNKKNYKKNNQFFLMKIILQKWKKNKPNTKISMIHKKPKIYPN